MLWPQRSDCINECPSVPPAHSLPTYYLSPETQGLKWVHICGLGVFGGYLVALFLCPSKYSSLEWCLHICCTHQSKVSIDKK